MQILESQTAFGIDNSGEVIDVTLAFERHVATYVREELQATALSWREEHDENRMLIHVRARNNSEFMRWILQYGPDVKVIAPNSFREDVQRKIREMLESYEEGRT